MRVTVPVVFVAVASLLAGCIEINVRSHRGDNWEESRVQAQRTEAGEVPATLQTIEIANQFGKVTVTGADEGWGWNWQLSCWASTDERAREFAGQFALTTSLKDGRLELQLQSPSSFHGRRKSDLTVRVPRGVAVTIKNSFGPVEVTGLKQTVQVHNQHGPVQVADIAGAVNVDTSYGALAVQSVGPTTLQDRFGAVRISQVQGDLHAAAAFGSLKVTGVSGDATLRNQHANLEVRAVSGAVRAQTSFGTLDVESPSPWVEAQNTHGPIHLKLLADRTQRVTATTSFGAIDVGLPADAKPFIRAQTSFGSVRSDFPVLIWNTVSDAQLAAASGQPKLSLRTQHANITVRKVALR